MGNNLDKLSIAVARRLNRFDIVFADLSAVLYKRNGKTHSSIRLLVGRTTIPVCRNLGIIKLGKVFTNIGMRRQAVVTAIDLGNSKGNTLTRLGIKSALCQRTTQTKIAFKASRAVCRQTKQVRNRSKLLFNSFKKWLGTCRCGIDRSRK